MMPSTNEVQVMPQIEDRIKELLRESELIDTSTAQGLERKHKIDELIKINARLYRHYTGQELQ